MAFPTSLSQTNATNSLVPLPRVLQRLWHHPRLHLGSALMLKPHIFDRLKKFVGERAAFHALQPLNLSQPLHRVYPILHVVWGRSGVAQRAEPWAPMSQTLYRQDGVVLLEEAPKVALLRSAKYEDVLRRYHRHGCTFNMVGPSPQAYPVQQRCTQVVINMEGPVHHS